MGEGEREDALWAETEPQHEMGLYVCEREGGRGACTQSERGRGQGEGEVLGL